MSCAAMEHIFHCGVFFRAFRLLRERKRPKQKNHPLSGWSPNRLYLKIHLFDKTELFRLPSPSKRCFFMVKEQHSAHTKWLCKYPIAFTPKYRRKVIYGQYRKDPGKIIRQLCDYKGIEIMEGDMMIGHVHMLVMIPPKYAISSVMGYMMGKSSLMIFDEFSQLKYRYGNRRFWSVGYYVGTTGLNEASIRKYIRDQD